MTQNQTITKIADTFSINAIYARRLFHTASKEHMFEDIAKLLEEKPKPFVKWVGGKRQLLKQFRDLGLYPPENFDPITNTFFEPFVGGGAVFFDLLPETAYLSDLNNELVVTYNVIKNDVENPNEFVTLTLVTNTPYGNEQVSVPKGVEIYLQN